jgi:F0F1-type ATP synthase membrane subunit b/b'
MSRAAEIVANYVQGRHFYHHHTAEEFLAMAYDELRGRLKRAEQEVATSRKQMESTVHDIAVSFTLNSELIVAPELHDPTVWKLAIEPHTTIVDADEKAHRSKSQIAP